MNTGSRPGDDRRTEFVTTVQVGYPLDADGVIGTADRAALLAAWGVACP